MRIAVATAVLIAACGPHRASAPDTASACERARDQPPRASVECPEGSFLRRQIRAAPASAFAGACAASKPWAPCQPALTFEEMRIDGMTIDCVTAWSPAHGGLVAAPLGEEPPGPSHRDGPYRELDDAGRVVVAGQYENGTPTGLWSGWSSDGALAWAEISPAADGRRSRCAPLERR